LRRLSALLGIVVLGIGIWAINPYPAGALHDDAVYVILAKSLATGHGYRYLNLPGAPLASHFPPGYPALLAVLWRLWPASPNNVLLFKFANAVLLVIGYWALGRLLSRGGLSRRAASITAAIAVASVPMLLISTLLLSETLFVVVTLIALLLAEPFVAERAGDRRPERAAWRDAVVAGAAFGVATLVRVPGVALIGGAVACLVLWRRPRDAAIVFATSVIVLAPWQLWSARHAHDVPHALQAAYGSYTGWISDGLRQNGVRFLSRTVAGTAQQSFDVVVETVAPFNSNALRLIIAACLAVVVVVGARATWRRLPLTAAFLVLYIGIVLAFPWPPARYIWGVWPLLLVVPVLAIHDIIARRRWALGVIAAVPFAGYAWYSITGYARRDWLNIPAQSGAMLRPIVAGVRTHIPAGAPIAVTAEAAVHLYSQRPTVPFYSVLPDEFLNGMKLSSQADAMEQIMAAYPVRFLVATTGLERAVAESLRVRHPGALAPSDSFPGSIIYRVVALPRDSVR
jgi:hypothetical protein